MNFHSIEIDGVQRGIVCTQVIDTNDCFKAMMVIELEEDEDIEKLNTIESEDFCIRGVNVDRSDMEISAELGKLTVDVEQINGTWALCYVYV